MYVFSSYRRKWLFSLRLTKLCTRRQCLDSFASPFKKFNVLDRVARRYIDIFTEEIEVGKITQCENCGNLLSHFFWQKFRESNVFTKGNTKELIWRNFFWVTIYFSFFHTVNKLGTKNATFFREIMSIQHLFFTSRFNWGSCIWCYISATYAKSV